MAEEVLCDIYWFLCLYSSAACLWLTTFQPCKSSALVAFDTVYDWIEQPAGLMTRAVGVVLTDRC